jgi:quinol monooxygenase YgiN
VIGILIIAQVEPEQRRELMQTCKTWLSNQLPTACLERRVYEDALAPTDLLLEEQWLDAGEMNSYLSSERFRAVVGAVKVLGKLIDVRTSEMKIVETG